MKRGSVPRGRSSRDREALSEGSLSTRTADGRVGAGKLADIVVCGCDFADNFVGNSRPGRRGAICCVPMPGSSLDSGVADREVGIGITADN